MKNSLLVVGASGGIGGALVSALSQAGEHVIAVSRQTIDSPHGGAQWRCIPLRNILKRRYFLL